MTRLHQGGQKYSQEVTACSCDLVQFEINPLMIKSGLSSMIKFLYPDRLRVFLVSFAHGRETKFKSVIAKSEKGN